MAEKRKACFTFLLKESGKKKFSKVELFRSDQWPKALKFWGRNRFRIRVNGKWYDKKPGHKGPAFLYKTQIRDLLWRSIHF